MAENEENKDNEENEDDELDGLGIQIFSNDFIGIQALLKTEAFFGGKGELTIGAGMECFFGFRGEYKRSIEKDIPETTNLVLKYIRSVATFLKAKNLVNIALIFAKKRGGMNHSIEEGVNLSIRNSTAGEEITTNTEESEKTFEEMETEIADRVATLVDEALLEYVNEEDILAGKIKNSIEKELIKLDKIEKIATNYFQEMNVHIENITSIDDDITTNLNSIDVLLSDITTKTDIIYNGLSEHLNLAISKVETDTDNRQLDTEIENGITLVQGNQEFKSSDE